MCDRVPMTWGENAVRDDDDEGDDDDNERFSESAKRLFSVAVVLSDSYSVTLSRRNGLARSKRH